MINKKRKKIFIKFILFLIILIVITNLAITISKYETLFSTEGDLEVAIYLLKEEFSAVPIKLNAIVPRNDAYVYNFTVSNNNGTDRTETLLEYELKLVATTNLPLEYELYMNEKHTDSGATNIINSDVISQDEDGTYFRTMTTPTNNFGYETNETNTYQLVIHFPATYKSPEYQNLIEGLEIQINSKQII